jgi:hypothetical protein
LKVPTALLLKIQVSWGMTLHQWVNSSCCFEGMQRHPPYNTAGVSLTQNIKVLQSFETPETTYPASFCEL